MGAPATGLSLAAKRQTRWDKTSKLHRAVARFPVAPALYEPAEHLKRDAEFPAFQRPAGRSSSLLARSLIMMPLKQQCALIASRLPSLMSRGSGDASGWTDDAAVSAPTLPAA